MAMRGDGLDGWADGFLRECGKLAEAALVLHQCETGFMRLVDDGHGKFHAWIATRRAPASWRERVDIDWWATWLAGQHEPELRGLRRSRPDAGQSCSGDDRYYRQLANVHLEMMAYQLSYPPEAMIGDCTIQTYRDVLGWLIASALRLRDHGNAQSPWSEHTAIADIAADLDADHAVIARAVAAFTLNRENAAYHTAVPGSATAPLVRIEPDRLVWSLHGLTTEPLFFLARELRRRNPQSYHNSAYLREAVFRQDLYALFQDKRFVTGGSRIQLRRDQGDIRTDIDAVVFDRKTGTLGLFELKSQDPFARSAAERVRQRDNVLYANRQIAGALDWLKRHGADELLNRIDHRTAKRYRVQKVFPFVLGRYLAHFNDGAEPDHRAAWGTWPQVLRLLDGQPFGGGDANPIATLFNRIQKDALPAVPLDGGAGREIDIGAARLVVHASYAAFKARAE